MLLLGFGEIGHCVDEVLFEQDEQALGEGELLDGLLELELLFGLGAFGVFGEEVFGQELLEFGQGLLCEGARLLAWFLAEGELD